MYILAFEARAKALTTVYCKFHFHTMHGIEIGVMTEEDLCMGVVR